MWKQLSEVKMRDRTKAEKREWLKEQDWHRISSTGSETWTHDRYGPGHFFSLAAAYETERRLGD